MAAALVVLCHSEFIANAYLGGSVLGAWLLPGAHGADLFFVLSGFIMFWIHERDFDQPEKLAAYAFKRVTRIYPPYWAALALVMAILLVRPNVGDPWMRQPGAIASAILLLPYAQGSVLSVAWTLCYEVTFYLLFATLIIRRSLGVLLLALWVAASIIGHGAGPFPISFFTAPYPVHFALGMLAALIVRRRDVSHPVAFISFGVALFLLSASVQHAWGKEVYGPWSYALASAFIIAGLATVHINWAAPLELLGNASYSIYLVHYPLLVGTVPLVARLPHGMSHPAAILMAFSGGLAFYAVVERPTIQWAAKRRSVSRQGIASAVPGA
jgi:exopolysaccharide production protein ExoZ